MDGCRKLLLFDLDGTLLSSTKTVSDATSNAIKMCSSTGMRIGYITARSPRKVGSFLETLPCNCIAYYNGASVYAEGELLQNNHIPYKIGINAMLKIQDAYPDARIGAYLEPYNYFDGEIRNIVTKEACRGDISDLPHYDIQRIRIVFSANDDIHLDPLITGDMVYFVTSDGTAIISDKNANKENALLLMADWFKIPLSRVIAFGDDINDVNMIKTAGIGIAMGNAVDCLKQVADVVADTNDCDGIAKWINTYLLTSVR